MDSTLTTKEKIVELGRDFVQTVGYHAFKYQQVSTILSIKNAAVHHYFPSKEDLGVAIIKKDHADFLQMADTLSSNPATDKAERLLSVYTSYFQNGKNLCVIGACGSAYLDIPQRMQVAAEQYMEDLITWLTTVFEEGLQSGEFSFTKTPSGLAALWTAALPGALQLGQVRGADYFNQVINQLRETLTT